MEFLTLFLTFFKIGLFTFGGGYAMIPIIEDICVEKNKWITHDEMMDITVIAESTPGPIAINCATFVGYKRKGILGAISTTFGVVLPSFIIIYVISMFLDNFLEYRIVAAAFTGIKIAVAILVINAGINMLKKAKKTKFSVTVTLVSLLVIIAGIVFSVHISTIILIIAAALVSVAFSFINTGRKDA